MIVEPKSTNSYGDVLAILPYNRGIEDLPHNIDTYLTEIDADTQVLSPKFRRYFKGTFLDTINMALAYSHKEYDTYLIEDAESLFAAPQILAHHPDATIIYYFADHRLVGKQAYQFDIPSIRGYTRMIERTIDTKLLRLIVKYFVDGIITNSEIAADIVRKFTDIPVGIAPTYVPERDADLFERVEPDLQSNTAVIIARGVDTKGVDMLLDAWRQIYSEHPDAELLVIGPNHNPVIDSLEGINYLGYIGHENLVNYLQRCSLYIQPSRFDVFPKTVLEGMRAGLPPIVTNTNGSADAVRDVDSSLIVEPDAGSIADRVISFFNSNPIERDKLSDRSREVSKRYNRDFASSRFERELQVVCNAID